MTEALRETLVKYGFEYNQSQFQAIIAQVNNLTHLVQNSGKAIDAAGKGSDGKGGFWSWANGLKAVGAALAGNEILGFVGDAAQMADGFGDLAEQVGVSAKGLQAWGYAVKLNGGDVNDFTAGLRKLNVVLAGGADLEGNTKLLSKLKLNKDDFKDVESLLPALADKFQALESPTERAALAAQLFGNRSGPKLAVLLAQGSKGVEAMRKEFEALGGGFSDESIKAASDYNDNVDRLHFSFQGLKSQLLVGVLPALDGLVKLLTQAGARAGAWLKETTALETAIKGVAVAAAVTLATALAPYLLPGLKFLALFLAVDDFIAFLEGKDSVIGAILTGWFGPDTTAEIRSFFQGIGVIAEGTFNGIGALWEMLTAKTEVEQDKATAKFLGATQTMSAAFDNFFDSVGIVIGGIVAKFYAAITDIEVAWNQMIAGMAAGVARVSSSAANALRSNLGIDTKDAYGRQLNAEAAVQGLRDNINARRDSAVTGGAPLNVTGSAPLKAPVVSTNYVEVNAPVSVTLPSGVTGGQARQLARDAARGALDGHRAALQSLEQRGGK